MEIEALNLLAGSRACNARCPFCISRMTPEQGVNMKEAKINWRNFRKACLLSKMSGAKTVKITGKGEPTLFPKQITAYLKKLKEFDFPLIELQTNGILLAENKKKYEPFLKKWNKLGLNTIIISIVHYEAEKNRRVFIPHKPHYINLPGLIKWLHKLGFSVRLSCIMADSFICSPKHVENLIAFAKQSNAEQLTIIPVNKPGQSGNRDAEKWVEKHCMEKKQIAEIQNYLAKKGKQIMKLMHGAVIYDVSGQNVCIAECLTTPKDMRIRYLIFFPDGHLRYDWQYEGAVIL